MNRFFYTLAIRLFSLVVKAAGVFNGKALLFTKGRINLLPRLAEWRNKNSGKLVWFHCASLGEFEQGRPVMESLKNREPSTLLLLTFFSPSGYEVQKNYSGADFICYLPLDLPANTEAFLSAAMPSLAVFVKYEYWANYFFALQEKSVPLYVISAIFRPDQRFFGISKTFWKKVLSSVTHFYLQNDHSAGLLKGLGFTNYTVAGDTRFDRVLSIASEAKKFSAIEVLSHERFTIVAGSTYGAEEEMLATWLKQEKKEVLLIIAPHEISEGR
ncbi:MAG: 3-deoxy-D-manno-octulosonic acid transferase, partial [Crocinitomicaceae bacterium]|nr:3-deoxy-D-manno-octulosonic acid transferase [Crocinitomicaceae bacterium]